MSDSRQAGPGIGLRVFIALVVVAGYWALASILNWHTAVVAPSGVRLTLFPFPTGSGQFLPREEITVCYGRYVYEITEEGWEADHHFTMGVETRAGYQADIHSRYETADEALAAAHHVSLVLNSNPAYNPIKVGLVEATAESFPTIKRQIVLWVIISVIAMIVGAAWDRTGKWPHFGAAIFESFRPNPELEFQAQTHGDRPSAILSRTTKGDQPL